MKYEQRSLCWSDNAQAEENRRKAMKTVVDNVNQLSGYNSKYKPSSFDFVGLGNVYSESLNG